jgi:hypothetical protein
MQRFGAWRSGGLRGTNVQISTNVDSSTNAQFSTNAPILPNPC